jgi:hypothetical protein
MLSAALKLIWTYQWWLIQRKLTFRYCFFDTGLCGLEAKDSISNLIWRIFLLTSTISISYDVAFFAA